MANYVNLNALTYNVVGIFGNAARNLFKTLNLSLPDTAITKNWKPHEQYEIRFPWELFNTINLTSFDVLPPADPKDSDIADSSRVMTSIGPIVRRIMQEALKLTFYSAT
jgi:hypothetical protein